MGGEPLKETYPLGLGGGGGVSSSHTMNDLIDYISSLTVTQGRYMGEKLALQPWQKRFLRGAFGQDGDAALTVGRGAGKTTLIAAVASAALDGPLMVPNSETVIVASSFEQARLAFRHLLAFMAPKIEAKPKDWRIQDSANRAIIENRLTGASVRCLGSDPKRLHGLAPRLIICDELAQWPENQIDPMLAALRTSRGKIENSKMLMIGTRAASPEHPFELALQTSGYSQVHAARETDPPFQKKTWLRANPSLAFMPDLLKVYRQEAAAARIDPSALSSFKALRLNQGVSDHLQSILIEAELWRRLETDTLEPAGDYVLGVDLGTSAALSAGAAYFENGSLHVLAVLPEEPSLDVKGKADGVGKLYQNMAARGELHQIGKYVADIEGLLRLCAERWGYPSVVVADRWREAELRQALERVRYPVCDFVLRGMGFFSGGQDVREFRRAAIDRRVRPAKSLLLRSCMSSARVVVDQAGNSKLSKGVAGGRQMRARDDAVAATILAVAEGSRRAARPAAVSGDYVLV